MASVSALEVAVKGRVVMRWARYVKLHDDCTWGGRRGERRRGGLEGIEPGDLGWLRRRGIYSRREAYL